MDLDQHLDRLGALLDRERAAEKDRFARLPLPERIRKGLGLDDVEAVEEAGLAGRSLVTYARPGGRELGAPQLGVGSIVRVLPRRDPSDDAPAGIVARRQRASLGIVFDEPPPGWATQGRVLIELLPSSATHDRLSGAVRRMREARRWHPVLRGDAPRFEERARPAPGIEHALNPEQALAAELVAQALRLRADARKRNQRRGPGRFSEARAQEREARQLLSEARELEDRAESAVLDKAQVVLATLTGIESRALEGRRFSLAVVDEATQAVEPGAYLALLRAERAVLAGDHLQLPPTVLAPDAQELSVSLFERVSLAEQHRMNEQIMRYPSDALYGGKLRAHPAVARHAIDDAPLELIDTAGRGFEDEMPQEGESKLNPGEAELVAAEVRKLLELLPPQDIAVISPYDAQVQKLRELLHDVGDLEIDTVDGFQGREKEAVVVSLVRSNPQGELGFVADIRRINVALTRARKKLIVVGDSATIARHPFHDGFVRYAESVGAWRSAWDR